MSDEERLKIFSEVKASVLIMVKNVFEAVDKELNDLTFTYDDRKLIQASKAKLAIRTLKTMTIDSLKAMGSHKERK